MICLSCLPWYLEWRSAEGVPKLHFPFPYANIRVSFNRSGVTFGVAVPWGCTLLQFENQSLGLKKKACTEVSFSEGFMPKSPACSVGLPVFSNDNVSH